MTDYVAALVDLLNTALRDECRREQAISSFQRIVWAGVPADVPEALADILRELAYDLDYFESNDAWRAEDRSYYGPERLEVEIRNAIARIE